MNLSYSSEQLSLQDAVKRFCDKSYNFLARKKLVDSDAGYSKEHWKLFAELGWLGAALPEDVGGAGGSAIDTAIILEGFGRALVIEPFVACAVLTAQTLNAAASDEQRRDLLRPLVRGDAMILLAHSEVEVAGQVESLATRATATAGGGYILEGAKSVVFGGPFAQTFVVSARTGGEGGSPDGISLFLVPADAPGLELHHYRLVDGSRASDLRFTGLHLPEHALIGKAGAGAAAIELGIDHATVAVCAEACGAMDSALYMTRDYLKTRSQYGATLNTYQALQHRMADMLVESEMSRSMLFQALNALEQDDPAKRQQGVSASKVLIGQRGQFVGSNAIQLHGGMGMTEEYMIGHYFKRLVSIATQFGSAEFHLERFGRTAN
jgi:alkylation response protein AidB-like acyl-CoA dehydrogenase